MFSLAENRFAHLMVAFTELLDYLMECSRKKKRLDEVERGLDVRLRQLGRLLLAAFAKAAGYGDCGDVIERNGQSLKRSKELHTKIYHSIFGRIEIERYLYWRREKQAAEYIPTDAQLGLPAGEQSYVLEDWAQRLATNQPYGEVKDILKHLLHIEITVRALETMNQRLADHVNPYWESAPCPTPEQEGEILVVSADGKGVPMRQAQADRIETELGKKKVVRRRKVSYKKTDKRRGRGEHKSCKQMAYLGVVYSVDRFVRKPEDILQEVQRKQAHADRPDPQHKRFRAEMNDIWDNEISYGQPRLFEWLASEVQARDLEQNKTVVCLMDGQKSLWHWQRRCLERAVGILDIYHVLERIWKAAHCFHAESSVEAAQFVDKYLQMMLEGNIGCVVGVFRRLAKQLRGSKKKELELIINFFHRNKKYMRYDRYIRAGYPIGSGVIEGGCRHVVRDRMELSGMRWTVAGAQAMLRLRTTKISGNWNDFIAHRIDAEIAQLYPPCTLAA
jgi:hypothetical protein